jgi:hypothetical protein
MNCFCNKDPESEMIVSKETFDKYVKAKMLFLIKRIFRAIIHSISALLITLLYYFDIGSDVLLSIRYYENGDSFWSIITMMIVAHTHFMYSCGIFYLTLIKNEEVGYKSKRKGCKRIIWNYICIIIPFEMLNS